MQIIMKKKIRKKFEVLKFFVRTNWNQGLSEQSADSSGTDTSSVAYL